MRERRGGRQWINSQSTAEQEQAELKELEATEEGERRRRREGSARVSQHLIKQRETTAAAAAARFEGTRRRLCSAALSEWVPRGRRGGSHDVLPTAARFSSHSPGGAIVRKEPQGTRRSALTQSF